jgi:hypothetical protein
VIRQLDLACPSADALPAMLDLFINCNTVNPVHFVLESIGRHLQPRFGILRPLKFSPLLAVIVA